MTRARLIVTAWGERYLDDLMRYTVPSILAPGNLPALAEEFACEIVLVTETHLFDRVKNDPSYPELCRYATVILKPVDDLISPWYGISLTYAYTRGYVDLGEEITDSFLLFLNADFIMADGCYRSLIPHMRNGAGAIFAPSYCTIAEDVAPLLESRIDKKSRALAIAPRELAAMVLEHRHNTVRGKTVNDGDFHMHWIDQFYWKVDDGTLLARQLPIAVVCLKPNRALIEPTSFWDYGVVYDICRDVPPTILADSDDFLMLELRGRDVAREEMEPGWPEASVIAERLSKFTSDYMRDFGRHTLILHSGPLPADISEGKSSLAHYVGEVYRRLSPPKSYRNHEFWEYHWPNFHRYRAEAKIKLQLFDRMRMSEIVRGDQIGIKLFDDPTPTVHGLLPDDQSYDRRFGLLPWPTINNPYHDEFLDVMKAVEMPPAEDARRILITGGKPIISPHVNAHPGFTVTLSYSIARMNGFHPVHIGTIPTDATLPSDPGPGDERQGFDFCFCELTFPQILSFRKTYENLRPAMKPGARIVAFHVCFRDRPIARSHVEHLVRNFPQDRDLVQFYFTGYCRFAPRIALRLFHFGLSFMPPNSAHGDRRMFWAMMLGLPFARLRSMWARWRRSFSGAQRIPAMCTSITIEIKVAAAESGRAELGAAGESARAREETVSAVTGQQSGTPPAYGFETIWRKE